MAENDAIKTVAFGAFSAEPFVAGALAIDTLAIGGLAIGCMVIACLEIIRKLQIDELTVKRLKTEDELVGPV